MTPQPLRSILAATDLDEGSDAIVSSAARLAARTGAALHLMHSLDLPWEPSAEQIARRGFRSRQSAARDRLTAQIERAVPAGLRPASQEVVTYTAHRAILDRAGEVMADLIVVGPHRGGPAHAFFLGTTADRVIRTSEVPCLVVDEPLAERVGRIGVPVDFSDPSRGALEVALAWALQMGTAEGGAGAPEIRVMYVGWPVEMIDDPDLEQERIRPELEDQIEKARRGVAGSEALKVTLEVRCAHSPTEETVSWAERANLDLLVMGTHGRSGLKRALIGSMASGVARRTPRPVLLVPPSKWSGAESDMG